MAPTTHMQAAGVLLLGFERRSSPEAAETIAAEVGYNSSPLFGARKARMQLLSEIVMVNAALTIVAVNEVFEAVDAKTIIDLFLAGARKSVFESLEKADTNFKSRYEQRLAEYYRAIREQNPGVAVSFCFLRNLGLNPLKNLSGQVCIAKRLGESLTGAIAALRTMQLMSPSN